MRAARRILIAALGLTVFGTAALRQSRSETATDRSNRGPSGRQLGPAIGPREGARSWPASERPEAGRGASSELREGARPRETSPVDEAEREFWRDLGVERSPDSGDRVLLRERLIARTARYLGLDDFTTGAFREATLRAAAEADRAWQERSHGAGTPEEDLQRRYEESNEKAFSPVVVLLGSSPRGERLRERFLEWFDAVR